MYARWREMPAICYDKTFNLKPFWQSSLLRDVFDIASKDHDV
jgi:hypothetical protein